jgi:hypothetical protein
MIPVEVPEPLRAGRQGKAVGEVTATWLFGGERPDGLKVIVPGAGPSTVTVSECPPEEDVIEPLHLQGGTLREGAVIPYRGHLQVTRSGPGAIFVAVHTPFEGEVAPEVQVAWDAAAGSDEAVALQIACGRECFALLHTPEPGEVRSGALRLDGRAAVATVRDGQLASLCLAEGTSAGYGEVEMSRETVGNAYGTREGAMFRTVEA